jgi:hypothetical protein
VEALANDGMEGRDTGSEGHRKAARYVAEQFERAALKPVGSSGYLQPVKFTTRRLVEAQSSLELVTSGKAPERLVLGEDALVSVRIDPAEEVEAPLVFAGYGLVVPELQYDDLAGLDLSGKLIVTISGGPSHIPGPLKAHYQSAGERTGFLRKAGVIGVVSIANPNTADIPWSRTALSRLQPAMSLMDASLVDTQGMRLGLSVNPARASRWFAGSGHTFEELLKLADEGKPLPRFPLPLTLRAKTKIERSEVESQNVAAYLPGSDPVLRNEYIVLSAHLDHVGVGRPINGDRIYNGAMDNAAGIASLIEIARALHESKAQPKRSIVFAAVTGEEKGLLGSRYFAARAGLPVKSLAANLNLDMFLPLFPLKSVTVYGLNESDLGEAVRAAATPLGIAVLDDREPQRNLFIRSDQYSFIRNGVPSLSFKVGYEPGSKEEQIARAWLKERYHAPSDDLSQPVDLNAAAGFNRLILTLAESLANRAERPRWKDASFFRRFAN